MARVFYRCVLFFITAGWMMGMGMMLANILSAFWRDGISPQFFLAFGLWLISTSGIGFIAGMLWIKGEEWL